MPSRNGAVSVSRLAKIWLTRSWWLVFPAFLALTLGLTRDRMCGDPTNLLPGLMSQARLALGIAAVYVLAHVWIAGAYLVTASQSDSLLPPPSAWRATWRSSIFQILLMVLVGAVEYAPISVIRVIGGIVGCGR
jgi:hypothetical protein